MALKDRLEARRQGSDGAAGDGQLTVLEGVRGGIPFAAARLDVMLRVVAAAGRPVARFADFGCGDGVLAGAILGRPAAFPLTTR